MSNTSLFPDLLLRSPLYLSKRAFRIAFLAHRDHFAAPILDVGCGNKPFLRFLPEGVDYTGVDYSDHYGPDVCASADDLPFPDERFNTVFCTEVLEHVPNPSDVLDECYRVLKPNGMAYITVPMTWYLHYEPYDFYRYTKYGIRHLCEQAGFEVLSLKRVGGFTYYLCLRMGEFAHRVLTKYVLAPLKWIGVPRTYRRRLSSILLIPYQLIALVLIFLFDRFSPRDAKGWILLTQKKGTAASQPEA